MKNKDFRLDYCDECEQMTNHIGDDCMKCKEKEKGVEQNYDDLDEYDKFEDNHKNKRRYDEFEDEDER